MSAALELRACAAGPVVPDPRRLCSTPLLDHQRSRVVRVDNRADLDALGAQLPNRQRPEFVGPDPADPGRVGTEAAHPDGHVRLGAADAQVQFGLVTQRAGMGRGDERESLPEGDQRGGGTGLRHRLPGPRRSLGARGRPLGC